MLRNGKLHGVDEAFEDEPDVGPDDQQNSASSDSEGEDLNENLEK